jgi:hypothetical protein
MSIENASPLDKTANDAPHDERRTSTTYSADAGSKRPPFNRTASQLADARTYLSDTGERVIPERPTRPSAVLLCASQGSKIRVGRCTDCALAATTAANSSAILDANTNAKESIVDELVAEIEVEEEQSAEDARIYAWRAEQLSGLGLSSMVASAVATFIDWHEIARLVERGCSPELALEIVR